MTAAEARTVEGVAPSGRVDLGKSVGEGKSVDQV